MFIAVSHVCFQQDHPQVCTQKEVTVDSISSYLNQVASIFTRSKVTRRSLCTFISKSSQVFLRSIQGHLLAYHLRSHVRAKVLSSSCHLSLCLSMSQEVTVTSSFVIIMFLQGVFSDHHYKTTYHLLTSIKNRPHSSV